MGTLGRPNQPLTRGPILPAALTPLIVGAIMKLPLAALAALTVALSACASQGPAPSTRPMASPSPAPSLQTPARHAIDRQTFQYATKGGEKLYLDRYVSRTAPSGKRPVLIFSFGGGWESGQRYDAIIADFAEYFADRGYVVVSIDYRLGIKAAKASGQMTAANALDMYLRAIDLGVEDLFDATSYVVGQAQAWNIDPTQIVISGSSAGATNSLVATYNQVNQTELARAHLPPGFRYAGAISMAGAFWLPAKTPLTWKSAPPPIQFIHGAKDQLVTYDEQQVAIAAYGPVYAQKQLAAQGYSSWFIDLPQGDHLLSVGAMFDYRDEMDAFMRRMIAQGQQMTIHTVETDKTPKTFGNLGVIYGAAFKAAKERHAEP
ncbi:alpha/beta hydrolase [Caulobacter radicis]|uniref:Alpha/beta hydrolase n=2 Tax=Caulobacter radicis TaxID=2172650 RepID=A0A2T9J7Q3_9CAUL|nr:alpha/beta hydrolase [Caulobacter radicis]